MMQAPLCFLPTINENLQESIILIVKVFKTDA